MKEIDENILKDLIAGKEEREEEKNEIKVTRNKKKNDYTSLFLKPNPIRERRGIYISKDNYERISVLTRLTNNSISGYIDNIITQHLELYGTDISNVISEQISKLKP